MKTQDASTRADHERDLDLTLAGSFPASDPPYWTLGVSAQSELDESVFAVRRPAAVDVVVRDGRRLGGIPLASFTEAIAMMSLLPLAILIAGVPVVALVWGMGYVVRWLTGSG
jgi:hypothetical protein